jgi:hypothetical protein
MRRLHNSADIRQNNENPSSRMAGFLFVAIFALMWLGFNVFVSKPV